MSDPTRRSWRLDVSDAVPLPGRHELAADVVLPPEGAMPRHPVVLSCLPGGFLTRRYYDLEVDGSRGYGFADAMARRGFVVVAFDNLASGESTRPDEARGFELGVEDFARAGRAALDQVLARLGAGRDTGLPPLSGLRSVAVGHSMGSCLSVVQQAVDPRHAALVLFSFTSAGLPGFLSEDERRAVAERGAADCLVELARARFGSPWPGADTLAGEMPPIAFQIGSAPESARRALQSAATHVLAIPGLLAMLPGGYAPWAERIEVPVLITGGEHDLHGIHEVPREFPRSASAVAYELPDAWHCHFIANTRAQLWDRVDRWLRDVLPDEASP